MEHAEELERKWHSGTFALSIVMELELKFVNWATDRYRDLRFNEEMNQKHKNMSDQWHQILVTAKAWAKTTNMRKTRQHIKKHSRKVDAFLDGLKQRRIEDAKREADKQCLEFEKQQRAVAKFRADRTQSRIEASERVGAVMQSKMQERALR